MMTWPDNKRIAVMMAFDLDAETMWTTRGDGNHDHITNLSRGAYGPKQGVPRILDMLDVYGIKATFFIPGVIAEHYPLVVKEISRRGHEIGFHGYLHEESTATSYEEEDATMTRCETIIKDLTGQSMAGHRGPGGVQGAVQPDGHHQTFPRPVLFPAHRQRGGGEQPAGIEADLAFLHLHRDVVRKGLCHALRQGLIQRQFQRFSVKEELHIGYVVLRDLHRVHSFLCPIIITRFSADEKRREPAGWLRSAEGIL